MSQIEHIPTVGHDERWRVGVSGREMSGSPHDDSNSVGPALSKPYGATLGIKPLGPLASQRAKGRTYTRGRQRASFVI